MNIFQKNCNISEVTCKREISSSEEHNISFALNDDPKSSYIKVLPTSNLFRNKLCIFNTSNFIHRPLFFICHRKMILCMTCVPHTKRRTSVLLVLGFINKICLNLVVDVCVELPWHTYLSSCSFMYLFAPCYCHA